MEMKFKKKSFSKSMEERENKIKSKNIDLMWRHEEKSYKYKFNTEIFLSHLLLVFVELCFFFFCIFLENVLLENQIHISMFAVLFVYVCMLVSQLLVSMHFVVPTNGFSNVI